LRKLLNKQHSKPPNGLLLPSQPPIQKSTTKTNHKDIALDCPIEFNILPTWQAGVIAFFLIFLAGAILAYHLGLFDPENVPDFVVNNNEMYCYFPAIVATSTEPVNIDDSTAP